MLYVNIILCKKGDVCMVKADGVVFEYIRRDENGDVEAIVKALDHINMHIKEGEFVAILGHNGSGKSTFAKHINALLMPGEGTIYVNGYDVNDRNNVWNVRQSAGMVFQNPDNQIVGTIVEEDVGFGPENIGLSTSEIWKRVDDSLDKVGMLEYRYESPNKLSGGQKQKVAIAGILALRPKCIIFDEPTAMLDPVGRKEIMEVIYELNKKEGITIILVTHNMEEVINADRIFVMEKGSIVMEGRPREIFAHEEQLRKYKLDVPKATKLANELRKYGVNINSTVLDIDELVVEIMKRS
jgi:energy-coupling factor transporter ATPase